MDKKEYIERDYVLRSLTADHHPWSAYEDSYEIVQNAPTADVAEVKHGEWKIKRDDYDYEYMICSVCKEEFYPGDEDTVDTTPNYCPHCGAKMDKKTGGEADA